MDFNSITPILELVTIIFIIVTPIIFYMTKKKKQSVLTTRTAGKGDISYGIINEDGTLTDHKINKSKLQLMGKWITIPHSKDEDYIIIQDHEHLILRKGLLYAEYFAHQPYPRSFAIKETKESANEVADIADTKVWKDLLTLSLTEQIGQTQLILFVILMLMNLANLYLSYSSYSQMGTLNDLVRQVVRYLFPNAGV